MLHLKQISLLILFLLAPVLGYADGTSTSAVSSENVPKTYTRINVIAGKWESFCLPMDITTEELQKNFDKIYVAYIAQPYYAYEDIDDATESGIKRRKAATTAVNTSTTTAAAEQYSEEQSYWTGEESVSYRQSFAYSATGSCYHFFMVDFTDENEMLIPQGMPFFAHVKEGATGLADDGTLTLNGFLDSDDTPLTGIVTKTFPVYSDQTLQTEYTSTTFNAIGQLSDDSSTTISGTLYAINPDEGTFFSTKTIEQNHAYLNVSPTSKIPQICIYAEEMTDLMLLSSIDVTDPVVSTLSITDSEPTLVAGTYEAGNVIYTRTGTFVIDGNYSSFCLPFDFNVNDAPCFSKVYVPINIAFYNTSTEKLKLFLLSQTGIVKAGTPFLARLTGEDISITNESAVSYDGTATNPDETELTVFDYNGTDGVLLSNDNIQLYWGGTLTSTPSKDGMNTFNLNGTFGPRTSSSNLSPFRAYLIETNNSLAKLHNIEISFGDDETTFMDSIKPHDTYVDVYSIQGMLIRKRVNSLNALDNLAPGLYIVNGKTVRK